MLIGGAKSAGEGALTKSAGNIASHGIEFLDDGIRMVDQPFELSGIDVNRLNHIFGKAEHALSSLVDKFGTQKDAYNAVQKAANDALARGRLTPNESGVLPSGDAGNIINVGGMDVRLIGGRVENNRVILSSFSRKGL